jgi:hypothetical protein
MPTARPRHQITETPAVADAIDLAAKRWPGEPRAKLLLRLMDAGKSALESSDDTVTSARRDAIKASSGKYADAFGANYLDELRRDWPT